MPAAALAIVTIVIMVVLKFNPGLIDKMWEDQKVAIAGFYKENLQPVLLAANLTNEDVFNFAFNNELPLDNTRKQYLLLGYDDSGKEFFEIRSSHERIERESYNEFVSAMNLDDEQKQTVDSIIGSYSKALEGQVLVNEQNTIAINPNLWNLRKAIFADLLVASEKLNKIKFDRIIPAGISNAEKVVVVNTVEKLKSAYGDKYIFVTPDSIFAESYQFDSQQFEKEMREFEKQMKLNEEEVKQFTLNIRYDSTFRYVDDSRNVHSFRIVVDSNICRVDLPEHQIPEILIPDIETIEPLIEQATNNIHFYAYKIPKIEKSESGIKIEYYKDDSVYSYVVNYNMLNIDSLVEANSGMDLYSLDKLKPVKPFDDSMLIKYQFDRDYYNRYYSDDEFKKQMEQLQKELQQMSEELKNHKIRVHTEVTKSPRK
jgi:DNA-binding protein YbaB